MQYNTIIIYVLLIVKLRERLHFSHARRIAKVVAVNSAHIVKQPASIF